MKTYTFFEQNLNDFNNLANIFKILHAILLFENMNLLLYVSGTILDVHRILKVPDY